MAAAEGSVGGWVGLVAYPKLIISCYDRDHKTAIDGDEAMIGLGVGGLSVRGCHTVRPPAPPGLPAPPPIPVP